MAPTPKRHEDFVLKAVLTFALVMFSLLFLLGVAVGAFYLVAVNWALEGKRGGAAIIVAIFFFAVYLLKYPWNALFRFTGSEVRFHGMRKTTKKDGSGDGSKQSEG
ncbi:MAG: hypothetical protein J0L76_16610 [Rhodobacterales bacterium]|nr:hypothetical protein [Rhodobacterales bacterium]